MRVSARKLWHVMLAAPCATNCNYLKSMHLLGLLSGEGNVRMQCNPGSDQSLGVFRKPKDRIS